MPTPMARRKSEIHLEDDSRLRRRATEKAAVVRIFIWYVTWKVATGRFEIATNCSEF